jgi:hypothetical protein
VAVNFVPCSVWKSASECGHPPMKQAPIKITSLIRRMCGGSQAQLVQGDDGHSYVCKFVGNPQGTRTLINEWIATVY